MLHVFPRFLPVACFRALFTSCLFTRAWNRLYAFALGSLYSHNKTLCFSFSCSEGKTTVNIIDPAFESKIRAKVADVFPFMKDTDVSEHYKMIEQVLEDEKMVK